MKVAFKTRLKMLWLILRGKQVIVITESNGELRYSWDTRSVGDAFQMCRTATNAIYLESITK